MMETTLSLASGTFVLLVRLFFILAAQVPPAGLRKENGKLKINYTFANGETSDVEVREEIGNLISGFQAGGKQSGPEGAVPLLFPGCGGI